MSLEEVAISPVFTTGGNDYNIRWLNGACMDMEAGETALHWLGEQRSCENSAVLHRCDAGGWWLITVQGRRASLLGGAQRAYGVAFGYHIGELSTQRAAALLSTLEKVPAILAKMTTDQQLCLRLERKEGAATWGLIERLRDWAVGGESIFSCDEGEAAAILAAETARGDLRCIYPARVRAPDNIGGAGLKVHPSCNSPDGKVVLEQSHATQMIDELLKSRVRPNTVRYRR